MSEYVTDEELRAVNRCLGGDHDAYEFLVNRYQAHVKALAWNITGSAEDALEITQETFLQAYKNLNRFDPNKKFKNWLLGITWKRGIDHIRKQKTFLDFLKRYAPGIPPGKHDTKPIEESRIFRPLLKTLTEKERAALSLQINENYSAKEIAGVLDCSENTVRVMLFKARKKLKNLLENEKNKEKNKDKKNKKEHQHEVYTL